MRLMEGKESIIDFFGDYYEAIKYFQLCLNSNLNNYQSLFGIAISLQMKDKLIESINYFKKFFELYSNQIFTNAGEAVIIDIGYKKTSIFEFLIFLFMSTLKKRLKLK